MAFSEKSLDIRPNFEPKRFPTISLPKIIGHYSTDKNDDYKADASMCKYLYQADARKHVRFDLNLGYELAVRQPYEVQESLDNLLSCIAQNMNKFKDGNRLKHDFVCFRGHLKKIMSTPYNGDWIILATNYRGTVYFCERQTDAKRELERDEYMKLVSAYGRKFEQYMLTSDPSAAPDTDLPVHESEGFYCLYETRLNGKKLLYAAEMDGIESDQAVDFEKADLNKLSFVELKCKRRGEKEHQRTFFRKRKLLEWWCQSFLVTVDKIIVGHRNEDGVVDEIGELLVKDIPQTAKVCKHRNTHSIFLYDLDAICRLIGVRKLR